MKIKSLHIQNFKSLVDFKLEDLNPFSAFVGPNASGKSNIFEALEFCNYIYRFGYSAPDFFDGINIKSFNPKRPEEDKYEDIKFYYSFEKINPIKFYIDFPYNYPDSRINIGRQANFPNEPDILDLIDKDLLKSFKNKDSYQGEYELLADNFSRIFVNQGKNRIPPTASRLSPNASNLPQILYNIFEDDIQREDFIEWLRVLIPEFENIKVEKGNIDGTYDFKIYEKGSSKPFPRKLLSDGTTNIISLMAAVYQSNDPQFLCLEEPENGLHPEAIQALVDFFRYMCETAGHHIWLNTHSPTLVRCLKISELVLINKTKGATHAKQFKEGDIGDIKIDEAWLTNTLGGGMSWSR